MIDSEIEIRLFPHIKDIMDLQDHEYFRQGDIFYPTAGTVCEPFPEKITEKDYARHVLLNSVEVLEKGSLNHFRAPRPEDNPFK